ncbi:hypothetical protein [Sulfurihydrogenibium sp.]|jgi:hypothetical protein|uniref:hypothetical protein n=1 Tax=Sulfurihydrogenibium sp. TaxID=2053621 RepID=UPI00262135B6|nr:hypothetical protein [Sulfurihydrogenibium sp.]
MAKIVKFGNFEEKPEENKEEVIDEVVSQSQNDEEIQIKKAVEEHILANFAVKEVLEMDIVYKINKSDIGVIGTVAYEHKRRGGPFIADFIAKGYKSKNQYIIDTLAFELGEPDLYRNIFTILKAKKALPEID